MMSFPATLKIRSHTARFNERAANYQLYIYGAEKESAAAWLAAATKFSPQSKRKNGLVKSTAHNLKSCSAEILKPSMPMVAVNSTVVNASLNKSQLISKSLSSENYSNLTDSKSPVVHSSSPTPSADKPKLLQPFGKDDRVRRTSILRPPSTFVASTVSATCQKKKVSFADSNGKQLENIRYFVISPQVTRRYSSYNAPTSYLTNGNYNSPWNLAISNNANRKPLGNNTSIHNVPQAAPSSPEPIKDYDFSHAKLAPHYELVASNFTSPSLQLNFNQRLEAQSVLLHSVTSAETTVYGCVSVMNLHFSKKVYIRYTFNDWSSYIEREATYMLGSHDGRTDKFSFVIYARPEDFRNNLATSFSVNQSGTYVASSRDTVQSVHPRIYFAIRFTTGDGRDWWDNNQGSNYCLNLVAY